MKKGKYQTGVSKRLVVLALALVLLLGCGIGGTIAWLMDTTETVTNTFTVGDVNIELWEHELNEAGNGLTAEETDEEDSYKIVPGTNQPKDPFVRVKANSEDSWIFVQVKEVNNTVSGNANATKYVDWTIAGGWTKLGETVGNVSTYYRTTNYTSSTSDETYYVLLGDTTKGVNGFVSYDGDLTKANLEAVTATKPQLIFKAFAVQVEAATDAETAWGKIDASAKLTATSNP